MPKVLFLGDIVGKPGRQFVIDKLPALRVRTEADFVVVNAENSAGGSGLNAGIARELIEGGVDAITLGDHVWDQRGFEIEIESLERVCRPANLPAQCPGRRFLIVEKNGFRLGIFTMLGRHFMQAKAECPFRAADALLAELRDRTDAFLIEIHAEATSEKIAFGWYLDGRAALVVGTHTHVPTADATLLPRGTAYLTDAGMCGPYAGVLGRETQPVMARFLDGMPRRFPVASGDVRLSGCLVDIDEDGAARSLQLVDVRDDGSLEPTPDRPGMTVT